MLLSRLRRDREVDCPSAAGHDQSLPAGRQASFTIFADHFKQETKAVHGHHKVVLVADKAGAHQESICKQRGIVLEPLPISPEARS